MEKLVITIIYSIPKEKALKIILESGFYEFDMLISIKDDIDFLLKLYNKTNDNKILDVVLLNDITIDIFVKFESKLDEKYKYKFIDRVISCNKISQILEKSNCFSHEEILYMWRPLRYALSSNDVCIIFDNKYYEKEDVEFLINRLCELREAKYLYLMLIDEFHILDELSFEQKNKLEKALKETKNVEYNLYYQFYTNKNKLIYFFGGALLLYSYIKMNEFLFENKEELKEICEELEEIALSESHQKEKQLTNILFREEKVKYNVKVIKK